MHLKYEKENPENRLKENWHEFFFIKDVKFLSKTAIALKKYRKGLEIVQDAVQLVDDFQLRIAEIELEDLLAEQDKPDDDK